MVVAYSGDRRFDRFFKTRFACEEVADRIACSESPSALLDAFEVRYGRQVESLSVTSDGVVCRVRFGNPPHIPVSAVETLLPAWADLADLIEGDSTSVASREPSSDF